MSSSDLDLYIYRRDLDRRFPAGQIQGSVCHRIVAPLPRGDHAPQQVSRGVLAMMLECHGADSHCVGVHVLHVMRSFFGLGFWSSYARIDTPKAIIRPLWEPFGTQADSC
jgi:hypothetical protein